MHLVNALAKNGILLVVNQKVQKAAVFFLKRTCHVRMIKWIAIDSMFNERKSFLGFQTDRVFELIEYGDFAKSHSSA